MVTKIGMLEFEDGKKSSTINSLTTAKSGLEASIAAKDKEMSEIMKEV